MEDLGTLPDRQLSEAHAINNSGEVVGGSFNLVAVPFFGQEERGKHAFIWRESTGMEDLNVLLPPNSGWELIGAQDINDSGQILCEGFHTGPDNARERRLCVLTPRRHYLYAPGQNAASLSTPLRGRHPPHSTGTARSQWHAPPKDAAVTYRRASTDKLHIRKGTKAVSSAAVPSSRWCPPLCSNRAATRVNLRKCWEKLQRTNAAVCRHFASSGKLQQTIVLPHKSCMLVNKSGLAAASEVSAVLVARICSL
jgi:hypothetical protein